VPLADKNLDAAGAPLDARTAGEIRKALDAFVALATRLAVNEP
jgi:hypothetical protein